MRANAGGMMLLAIMICAGCASTSSQSSQISNLDLPACISACEPGYECSAVVIQGVKTGVCVGKPTECVSDADCAKSAVLEGTVPLRYFCDKHSGAFPDKTGSAEISNHGTCLPTTQTGMDR